MAKILIVDDEETIRKLLLSAMQRKGHEAIAVEDGYRAFDVFETFQPDAIVSDIKMPRLDGFQMFAKLKEKHTSLPPVIFVTGHGEKNAAIESLRVGAFDYLEKPFDMEDLFHRVEAAIAKHAMQNENARLNKELAEANAKLETRLEARTELVHRIQHSDTRSQTGLSILGTSLAIQPVKEAITRLTQSELGGTMSVLITGASGSGKEVAAKLVHDLSPRSKGPWVAVNCGAIPENLMESEFFGHEKGAFTGANAKKLGLFELADGGTLFLDEIGELPVSMQSKLLRVIQEKAIRHVGGDKEVKVDVRIVAATNKDLSQEIAKKQFREDLYFRLNTFQIQLPTLSDRNEDIVWLAEKLLKESTVGMKKAASSFSPEAKQVLTSYSWPGNIRELKSTVQRSALLCSGAVIQPEDVRSALGINVAKIRTAGTPALTLAVSNTTPTTAPSEAPTASTGGMPYHTWKKSYMKNMERDYLQQQLLHFHGNVSAMSRSMKVSRPNLCRLLRKHEIAAELFRTEVTHEEKKAA